MSGMQKIVPGVLVLLLLIVLCRKAIGVTTVYWAMIVISSIVGFWVAIHVRLPNNTDAMAGFYLPRSIFLIPLMIPAFAAVTFMLVCLALYLPTCLLIERIGKKSTPRPDIFRGMLYSSLCSVVEMLALCGTIQ